MLHPADCCLLGQPLVGPVQVQLMLVMMMVVAMLVAMMVAMMMVVAMLVLVVVLPVVFKPVVLVVAVVAESCIRCWQSHSPPIHLGFQDHSRKGFL